MLLYAYRNAWLGHLYCLGLCRVRERWLTFPNPTIVPRLNSTQRFFCL